MDRLDSCEDIYNVVWLDGGELGNLVMARWITTGLIGMPQWICHDELMDACKDSGA